MIILVTGSSGFIGCNLVKRLISLDYKVVGLDSKPARETINNSNFKFEIGDLRDFGTLSDLTQKYHIDTIVHLAAKKIPRYGKRLETLLVNGIASENVFQVAAKGDIGVIFASTSDVYGMNADFPFGVNSNLVSGPAEVGRWSYSVSKVFSEHLLHGHYEEDKNPSAILRFFGAYGPHNSLDWTGGPIPVFINAALENRPIDIHGDGTQTRTFSYIDDHVEAIVSLLLKWPTNSLKTLNFGSTNEISIIDLARTVWSLINKDSKPIFNFIPYENFGNYQDVMKRVPKMNETIDFLGNHWTTSLENGLNKTIEWQRKITTT